MFVNDKLVYLQMQKTASTHIAKVLAGVVGGEQHLQHRRLVIDPGDRLVFASIRNPWSWYVSLWAYGCRGGGGASGLYQQVTAPPPSYLDIARESVAYARAKRALPVSVIRTGRETRARRRVVRTDLWAPTYTSPNDVVAFRSWLRLMFDPARAAELSGQPPRYGETALRNHGGFMTFRYFTLLADDRKRMAEPGALDSLDDVRRFDREHTVHDDMVRIESLESELRRVLDRAGYTLTSEQHDELHARCTRKTNESPHLHDRDYYDDESLELVAQREKFLIEKYGYQPPEPGATS